MWYIQGSQMFPVFTISFHHSKEVFVCCLIVSLRCVFWVGLSIRGGGNDSPRPASQRAAAFILTAAMLTTLTAPAFAKTWYIEEGDITISAGKTEGTNKVTQGTTTDEEDTNTTITNRDKDTPSSNTVTIKAENENDKVEVKLEDVNIKTTGGKAAVSVTGKGDTNIELNGDNELSGSGAHAALEHNQTVDGEGNGELTIQDKDKNGSLTATGGIQNGAGIGAGGYGVSSGKIEITGGDITAIGGKSAAGIGGSGYRGDADITISGGTIRATGGDQAAGIGGGGLYGSGNITITGDAVIEESIGGSSGAGAGNSTGGAGIGGGAGGHGTIDISGNAQVKNALGKDGGAGIGSGHDGDGNVTISGNATIENAEGGKFAAGIGGGYGGDSNVTISGNAKIDNVSGGMQAAGIGGGSFGDGTITIKDNAAIGTVTGGSYGAGVGGGALGVGDVTIEGNVTIKNAQGGSNAAGIGGGYGAENDDDGNGNQITIKSNESGAPTVNATGGVSEVDTQTGETIPGGAGIGSGAGKANANITLEGKVTIVAKAGEGNAAIGANGIEQEFTGLAEGSSITRYNSEGNNITLPTDPVPAVPSASGGGSADASVQESVFPGLVVTDKDGQRISYTSIRGNNVLSLRVGRFTASLRISLATLRQLRAEGIDTITFQTILCSTTLSVDELLAMGGEDAEAVLTHRLTDSSLTVG